MTNRKSVLCLVPLAPPITGAAYVSQTIVDYLGRRNKVVVLPYQNGTLSSGQFTFRQLFRILLIGLRLLLFHRWQGYDRCYLVLSSSWLGHHRDLYLLWCLGEKLRNKTVVHLHSALEKQDISDLSSPILRRFARRYFDDVRKGIVVGETWLQLYGDFVPGERVEVLKNFFEPDLLTTEAEIHRKFSAEGPLQLLFLSNLIREKGCRPLLDAFRSLPEELGRAVLHFAGNSYADRECLELLRIIEGEANVHYHGVVTGEKKRKLLADSHLLCFPTYYRYEAQGIVILEAYAAGCIVIATDNGGVKDVFADRVNGLICHIDIDHPDPELLCAEIREKLVTILENLDDYRQVALHNYREAVTRYSKEIFFEKIERILFDQGQGVGRAPEVYQVVDCHGS